jgi:hypothetical protein
LATYKAGSMPSEGQGETALKILREPFENIQFKDKELKTEKKGVSRTGYRR